MILYKGKAKDYSMKKVREYLGKKYGVVISPSSRIGEIEMTCQTSKERLEAWKKKLTT